MYPLNDLFMGNVEQIERELRNLSQMGAISPGVADPLSRAFDSAVTELSRRWKAGPSV